MGMLAFIEWDVDRLIARLGPVQLRWYGLFFFMAFAGGVAIMHWVYRRERKPVEDLSLLVLSMMAATLIGTRLGHCFFYRHEYYLAHPLQIFCIWKGGLASHGGVIGIGIGAWIYSHLRKDQPFRWLIDRLCLTFAFGACMVRLGNLMNSEIVGLPTGMPWGFFFRRLDNPFMRTVPLHPVQLYEALLYALVFLFLVAVYVRAGRSSPPGLLLGLFLITAFTGRFLIEFYKAPIAFYAKWPLWMGQILSIPVVMLGFGVLIYGDMLRRRQQRAEADGRRAVKG